MTTVQGQLAPFNTIGHPEMMAVRDALRDGPLSGYLGGRRAGGYWVERLEAAWREKFGVKHAIACNSATSGLLMACVAANCGDGGEVITTPYTMSATAAAPRFLGAQIRFGDIEPETFSLSEINGGVSNVDAVIITNLFGHPGYLNSVRGFAGNKRHVMIEDNSQSPLAMEGNRYAGTIGHIGVFSLNVHKHIQCGEGGVCVTDDDDLAEAMQHTRNHGEMAGSLQVGLNLRMTELNAAVACMQLERAEKIVRERIEIAESIMGSIGDIPGLKHPHKRQDCRHVYYCIAWQVDASQRDEITYALQAEGVPVRAGYLKPLYHLPAFANGQECPVAERVESQMLLYENCAFSPTSTQIKQIGQAFRKVFRA